jgi:pyruvate/2-oxoglutarate dehydrogenase complex dihydrolipoamide acyltransferase (E2) component
MATVITMPKWGLTMEEGRIVEWMVGEGEAVGEGEVLCVVETEKTNVELPSPCNGVVVRILVPEDQPVAVGTPIAVIAATPQEVARMPGGDP